MFAAPLHVVRLLRAARVLARHGGLLSPEQLREAPLPVRAGVRLLGMGPKPRAVRDGDALSAVSAALARLGPSWIKLGQFLATRPDIVGFERAEQLAELQDRLPPFPQEEAVARIREALGRPVDDLFAEIGPPVAAASIAQVHRARTTDGRDVAVKVLRPGVEHRFRRDLESFYFAARMAERFHPPSRRLKPVEVVDTLAHSVRLEMDLRMEAAAMSEMAENLKNDPQVRIPAVDWERTGEKVLTTEWVDGVPLSDIEGLKRAGHDPVRLADVVVQTFLKQLLRDGFFHADMHPGNMFVDADGRLVLVDFGIMGRLSPYERRVWAEILHCFIVRDYRRNAEVHFEAGYVPPHQSMDEFAQALRAIGEPVLGRPAEEVSMGELLGRLFRTTERFDMATQPQLLMMQKTMVVVEGVGRMLNPKLDVWKAAEPVVRAWIGRHLGPAGRLEEATTQTGRAIARLPELLQNVADAARNLAKEERRRETANAGARTRADWRVWLPLWLAAGALVALAIAQWW